jgi:hypothetical protein
MVARLSGQVAQVTGGGSGMSRTFVGEYVRVDVRGTVKAAGLS